MAGVIVDRGTVRRQRVLGVFYLLLGAIAAFVLTSGILPEATTTFAPMPAGSKTGLDIPNLIVPSVVTLYAVAALCAFLGAIQLIRGFGTRWAVVLGIAVAVFVFGFLTWAAVGKSMSLIGILQLTVGKAPPRPFGALSGLLCERAGVVNITIQGMLLTGAFTGAVVGSATGNNIVGLVAAGFVGAALGTLPAV